MTAITTHWTKSVKFDGAQRVTIKSQMLAKPNAGGGWDSEDRFIASVLAEFAKDGASRTREMVLEFESDIARKMVNTIDRLEMARDYTGRFFVGDVEFTAPISDVFSVAIAKREDGSAMGILTVHLDVGDARLTIDKIAELKNLFRQN